MNRQIIINQTLRHKNELEKLSSFYAKQEQDIQKSQEHHLSLAIKSVYFFIVTNRDIDIRNPNELKRKKSLSNLILSEYFNSNCNVAKEYFDCVEVLKKLHRSYMQDYSELCKIIEDDYNEKEFIVFLKRSNQRNSERDRLSKAYNEKMQYIKFESFPTF